jgi:hypothetical protein
MIGRKKTTVNSEIKVCDACDFGDDGPEAFKGVFDEAGGNGDSSTSEPFKTGSGARAGG